MSTKQKSFLVLFSLIAILASCFPSHAPQSDRVGGFTPGGAGLIINSDVGATAAIAGTKIAPAFGAQNVSIGAVPATVGDLQFKSGFISNFRNAANTADLSVIQSDASNNLYLGTDTAYTAAKQVNTISAYAAGTIFMGIGGVAQFGVDSTGAQIYANGGILKFGNTGMAAAGMIRLPNAVQINARNAAGTADVLLAGIDSANNVILGSYWDGTLGSGQTFVGSNSFVFTRIAGSTVMLVSGTSIAIDQPIIGDTNSVFSVHGLAVDATLPPFTVLSATYQSDANKFTNAGAGAITYPTATDVGAYYKTVINTGAGAKTIKQATGTSVIVGANATQRLLFDSGGVHPVSAAVVYP